MPSGNNCCQWVRIDATSPLADQSLANLHSQFPDLFAVQAMRREGNFMRSPELTPAILVGDRLLLCGTLAVLRQVEQWLMPRG